MNGIITFYICFLNFFSSNAIINKVKYLIYILISLVCMLNIIRNSHKVKINISNSIILKFIIFMMLTVPSTLIMITSNLSNRSELLSPYLRLWMFIPILFYITINKNKKLILSFVKYSIIINSFSLIDLLNNIEKFGRVKGVFSHPNFYAFYLVVLVISILYCINEKYINKKIGIIYIGMSIVMIAAAGSKTALITLVIILIYTYKKSIEKKNKFLKLPILIVSVSIFCIVIILFKEKLQELRIFNVNFELATNQINSFEWRILKWQRTFEHWNKSILGMMFGYGWGSEILYGLKGFAMHNEYLRIIFNCGLIGSISCMCFFKNIFKIITKKIDENSKQFYLSFILVIAIGCLSENIFVAVETTVLYLGILFNINSYKIENNKK